MVDLDLSLDLKLKICNISEPSCSWCYQCSSLALSNAQASRGVVTHSSGNHAAALARAARIRSIAAHIVMPENSAATKIASVRSFGFEPHFCAPSAPARAAAAEELLRQTGATLVHPYNDVRVICGQGTVGLEILQQWPDADVVLAPVGGGGLMSGLLVALKAIKPSIQVIAVEPELADDAARSLSVGAIQQPTRYDSIADGLRTSLGEITFEVLREQLDEIVLVSEAEISQAMRMLAEEVHLVVEPSGAVSLAGAIKLSSKLHGKNVCVVLSGGNLDFGTCRLGSNT
ncbi:MAG: pyridoxal-phosphate dependent enzyme [Pirellulales bacterium]